jgi:hypothetical protein
MLAKKIPQLIVAPIALGLVLLASTASAQYGDGSLRFVNKWDWDGYYSVFHRRGPANLSAHMWRILY